MCPRTLRRPKLKKQAKAGSTSKSFSHSFIESLQPKAKDYFRRDSKTRGLHIKITPQGRKSFLLRYDMPGKRGRKLNLGVFPGMLVPEARRAALEAWTKISAGIDPALEKSEAAKRVTVSLLPSAT